MNDQNLEAGLLTVAQAGDIEGLLELAYRTPSEESHGVAYKWLAVASDFGHEEADEMIDVLLEGPLHADDDNFVSGHAHFELAVSYLIGRDGLPVDFDKARVHVAEMVNRRYPYSLQNGEELLVEARKGMSPQACAVFDAAFTRLDNDNVEGAYDD
jgi:hypothetical protein